MSHYLVLVSSHILALNFLLLLFFFSFLSFLSFVSSFFCSFHTAARPRGHSRYVYANPSMLKEHVKKFDSNREKIDCVGV